MYYKEDVPTLGEKKFRIFLDIKRVGTAQTEPDLMVIMMNPGSSRPLKQDTNGNWVINDNVVTHKQKDIQKSIKDPQDTNIMVEALHDNTQEQIMKIMNDTTGGKRQYNYARVLNLSDLSETKNNKFLKLYKHLELDGFKHSIFDESRMDEFNQLFVPNVPVIVAWGVNKGLKKLSQQAINRLNNPELIGWKKEGFAYYHPLPRSNNKRKEWVRIILEQLKLRT